MWKKRDNRVRKHNLGASEKERMEWFGMLRSISGWYMHYYLENRKISKFKLDPSFCSTCKSSGVPIIETRNDELSRLPPHKDVEFTIELHPGTSPISMTPPRMVSAELRELIF